MGAQARLIVDDPAPGAWNMAVDEALLDECASPDPAFEGPTLRLYGWSPAALSLGRLQPALHDAAYLAAEGLDLVRRPTGGGAVLHDHERTYAIVGRLRQAPFPGGVLATYERIAHALVGALRALGLDARAAEPTPGRRRATASSLCFGDVSGYEITHGARKLVGSAQLRRRGAFLQHGSILVREDLERSARSAAAPRPSAGRIGGIETVLGRGLAPGEIDRALVASFQRTLDLDLRAGALSAGEHTRARSLEEHKYRSTAWTIGGREPEVPVGSVLGPFDPHVS